ncbi:MAG: lycopene cyclase family protein [Myxococcota bacterium]|nr:lycopene cyclase family protein [Myxococcota bacterium]
MSSPQSLPDILIVGAGPAARFLAAACIGKGLKVEGVAVEPDCSWLPRYGAWTDELTALPSAVVEDITAHSWAGATVYTLEKLSLDRAYVALSTPRLQGWLTAQCMGMRWHRGCAVHVQHEDDHSTVMLQDGTALSARVVVDATGSGVLLERSPAPSAWQTAYGVHITVPGGHPWPLDRIELMDFRGSNPVPSFLYAQPLDAERVFVEETTLIANPALSIPQLKQRLFVRLEQMGVQHSDATDEEHCRIQMLGPVPVIGQQTVGFGAAAGMVHPATGYQLARLPAAAAAVADALAAGLSGGPSEAAEAAWSALWSPARKRQWALYRFGAEILRDLDVEDTRRFFDAFFRIETSLWSGFLSASLSPFGLATAMTAVFSASSLPIRRHLIAAGASRSGLGLLRNLSRPSL